MRNRLHPAFQQVEYGLRQGFVAGKVLHHELDKAELGVAFDRQRQLGAPADSQTQRFHQPPQLEEELPQLLLQLLPELQLLEEEQELLLDEQLLLEEEQELLELPESPDQLDGE